MEMHVHRREVHILHLGKPLGVTPRWHTQKCHVASTFCDKRQWTLAGACTQFPTERPLCIPPSMVLHGTHSQHCLLHINFPIHFLLAFLVNFKQDYCLAYFLVIHNTQRIQWPFPKINSAGNHCALYFFQYTNCKSTTHWSLSYTVANCDIFFYYLQSCFVWDKFLKSLKLLVLKNRWGTFC